MAGKVTGFTKGRDRSFHFGTQEHKIIGMISHLGPQMALADGIALADLLHGNLLQPWFLPVKAPPVKAISMKPSMSLRYGNYLSSF